MNMTRLSNRAAVEAARELIANPKTWTRFHLARNASSRMVNPRSPEAVRWCAEGACIRSQVWAEDIDRLEGEALQHGPGLAVTNDRPGGRKKVLAIFDAVLEEDAKR